MALSSLFSKEGRHERALQKAIAKATSTKIKPDDRRPALHLLAQEGSPRAVMGLLGRLNFNYDINMVSDEEEKQYVFEVLVAHGEVIIPELKTYLKSAPTLSWGLRILEEISPPETVFAVAVETLAGHDPGYERDPTRKQQLLTFLGDFESEAASEAIVPFLGDHDETVRFICVEALLKQKNEVIAREPLLKLLSDEEEESRRIKNRIAEGFIENDWSVRGFRGTVERVFAGLGGDYTIDGKGKIRKKKGKN